MEYGPSSRHLMSGSLSGSLVVVLVLLHGTTTKSSTQLTTSTVNVPSSTPAVESCLLSENCWVHFNFTYDDSWNACHGQQYVRRTPYNTGRFIGVVVCSTDKYKLLMADHLEDRFLNIGDGSGAGEDLCELVGGQESRAEIPSDFWNSPAVEGFHRSYAGETPMRGKIGFGPKDMTQWTGRYFPTWYKCGVDIPGTSRVVWKSDSTISRTTTPAIPAHLTTLRSNLTTTEQQWIWDNVPHVQTKFSEDRIFIVPEGVTKMDVICIGGGGGGRDGQSKFTGTGKFGGDGGDSLFGPYLVAGGGKGGKEDDTGGEGGHGTVADGGQGGIGGGCSAGAGAAGQTSGGGGGLVAGSSTYPFCGGGGSSGGSSCGKEFATVPPGESGPGGVDPNGRAGGLYGGGGGSRAGGRAGGGGGYSRDVINVKPGERIAITVGQRGTPYYWAGRSAPGIVVISWGGPIDYPTIVVDTTTLSSEAIPSTASPPTPATRPYPVGGALRKCPDMYVYCEATDECEFPDSCNSTHCSGFRKISCDRGTTCYSYNGDKCDGVLDCSDGADELSCDKTCFSWQTSCDNGKRCYSGYQTCDGSNDCTDGADEVDCPCYHFTCNDNTGCYDYITKCNGVNDCADGSDENNCPSSDNTSGNKAGLSTGSIIGIVVGVIVLSICLGCCKYYCRKSNGSPRPTNTAAYFVPQTSAHHSTTTMPQNQPFQTTHHYTTGQPSTGSDQSYFRPQYPFHNNGQSPTNSNTTYPGSHYPGYAEGEHQPVVQPFAPSVNNPNVSIPQPGTTLPQPLAPPMCQPIPPPSDTTDAPPSYDSLYSGDK